MSKKGISPLIATVLIIGFTIVLAALVMQWGGGLFKSVQDQTGKTSEFKIICSSKLTGLEMSASAATGLIKIDNKNQQTVEGFFIRRDRAGTVTTYNSQNTAAQGSRVVGVVPLVPFDLKTYSLTGGIAKDDKLSIFPIVSVGTNAEKMICENEWKVTVGA